MVERLADYRWSSYGCLAYGRRCTKWLERASVLRLFRDDSRVFRREVQHYSEEEDRLLENLLHGLFLGSKEGLVRFLGRTLEGGLHREKPQTRARTELARRIRWSSLQANWRRHWSFRRRSWRRCVVRSATSGVPCGTC